MLSVFIARQEVVVSSGGAPTPAGINVHNMKNLCTHEV